MPHSSFHPATAAWFARQFPAPTEPQVRAWPEIQAGRPVLIAAPTGSGKTLAAFLAAIDELVRRGMHAPLPDETFVLYVSPLKALSNDIQKNLAAPISGIRRELARLRLPDVEVRTLVRTGDTPQAERASMRKRPPHIVVTTPESLYVLLGSESGRRMLATTRTVIIDEIHALAPSKRGSHLSLSLERLEALTATPPVRIGLSATQKPIEEVARFLTGVHEERRDRCVIIDSGHVRARDLGLEVPSSPLEAVMSTEVWSQIYGRLAELALTHRTTLVFVNTRRMAERAARHLSERLGSEHVMAHHGSMSKELRLKAEQRLKRGELKVLVATASLELGIDIGDVELVCQLGSPRSIAAFLQRAGRASHQVGGVPKARIFPLSRDELVECTALLDAVRRGELDRLTVPRAPLDVLAQQIVAEVAAAEWDEHALFALVRRAYPYAALDRAEFMEVVRMLAEGFTTRRGHDAAYVHRDAVHGMLRGRRGARLTALTSGGAIPDNADYDVVLEPASQIVGTVNEDFAVESLAGDVFQLGNTSYRILRVEGGRVRVEDAQGMPPSIPFWLGEAPGRSNELSHAVSRLREEVQHDLAQRDAGGIAARLETEIGIAADGAAQLVDYLAAAQAALTALPSEHVLVLERFFDESGGMQLVIHSPWGSRINRAWGLALRKRFCLKFNFELQAAATEDAIVLSLSTSHSFVLGDVARYLHSKTVRHVLTQAVLASPMFVARWRWIANTSLALPRFRGGRKVPAPLQRMRAEDLVAAVFPDQIACAENIEGEREIPDHPLVRQTLHDCLHEGMDIEGLEAVLARIEHNEIRVVARDLAGPSPLAAEILTARPYAYLDDAPLEERRTQAVIGRRWLDAASAADLGRLDTGAIERVRAEAWPQARNGDELHDALLGAGLVSQDEICAHGWLEWANELAGAGRASRARLAVDGAAVLDAWIAAERLPQLAGAHGAVALTPPISAPREFAARDWSREEAVLELVRSRVECAGPVTVEALCAATALDGGSVLRALARLVAEGVALEGRFTPDAAAVEWCERGLLARIHRYTVQRLRQEIEPVTLQDCMRFLLRWQHVAPGERKCGVEALDAVLTQLQGFDAPAAAWEGDLLPARLEGYDRAWLDALCRAGRIAWLRLAVHTPAAAGPVRSTPVTFVPRRALATWLRAPAREGAEPPTSSRAASVAVFLEQHGASFFDEIVEGTGLLRTQVEDALGELVALGRITADSFAGLRALITPASKRKPVRGRKGASASGIADAGRWTLLRRDARGRAETTPTANGAVPPIDPAEEIARVLLHRYGVVFWRMLTRESTGLPPWRDLLRALRRMEARGEIRGGRFVAGLTGEQFALPDAVPMLRDTRRLAASGELVVISAADPLNLAGILLPGPKVPALATNRIVLRDGIAVAAMLAGEMHALAEVGIDAATMEHARRLLVHGTGAAAVRAADRTKPNPPAASRLLAAWHLHR